jgi:hypothetical protein
MRLSNSNSRRPQLKGISFRAIIRGGREVAGPGMCANSSCVGCSVPPTCDTDGIDDFLVSDDPILGGGPFGPTLRIYSGADGRLLRRIKP